MPQVAINFQSRAVDLAIAQAGLIPMYRDETLAFRPPPRLMVDEWADQYRVLQAGTSRQPGPWRTATTPYLREVMQAYNTPEIRHIVLCFGTQLGKTETLYNILGYIIDLEPYSTLLIYPREPDAKTISRSRLQPMIAECPSLAEKIPEKNEFYQTLEMYFPGMVLYMVGSNSAAALSQKACRNILRDEIDKYPPNVGKDADPLSLSEERAKSFWDIRKIIDVSSPTLEDYGVWKQLQKCEKILEYVVPCPSCRKPIPLLFPNIKWKSPEDQDGEEDWKAKINMARTTAWYECQVCGAKIKDESKMAMLKEGEWRSRGSATKKIESIGFVLNSLYSPWLTWGEIAEVFLVAERERKETGSLQALQNFINGWLAEPWKQLVDKPAEGELRDHISPSPRREVPEACLALTAGVDVQQRGFYFTVWGWEPERKGSHLVDYGFLLDWNDVYNLIFNMEYVQGEKGKKLKIFRAAIDTGGSITGEGWGKTAEIYEWLRKNSRGTIFGVKGMSRKADPNVHVNHTIIDRLPGKHGKRFAGSLSLFMLDTNYFKEAFFNRLQNAEEGGNQVIHFHKDTRRDFIMQILSEEKRIDKRGKVEWVQVRRDNHYLDCTIYAMACTEENFGGGLAMIPGFIKPRIENRTSERVQELRKKQRWLPEPKRWL